MLVSLTIVRYPKVYTPFALLAMAVHRLPMMLQKGCTFWKLLGTGKNGTFTLNPDWQQWGILAVWNDPEDFEKFYSNSFIASWWSFFGVEKWTILCEPLQSHGKWGGREPFGSVVITDYQGPVIVLTRAKIRPSSFRQFWLSTGAVADRLYQAKGYIMSISIGERFTLPSTFSVWQNADDMKAFAYARGDHADTIKNARKGKWFTEDLFARFKPVSSFGSIKGENPLRELI